ncbi:MAG: FAD-dependent oxidoreductase [Nitratireductor sp.]
MPKPGIETPHFLGSHRFDIAIVGGGYAGLNAALVLARDFGLKTAVFEAGPIGWGASGRNGGFCCPGSAKLSWEKMLARHGEDETKSFHSAQRAAVDHVGELLDNYKIDADRVERGELLLAHKRSRLVQLREESELLMRLFGEATRVLTREELEELGASGPQFHGGLLGTTTFGLNPMKYLRGLARAADNAGVALFSNSPVQNWRQEAGSHMLTLPGGEAQASRIVVATNGYGEDGFSPTLRGRFLPALSRILVTRSLTSDELAQQGWTTTIPAADSRKLLHYFRLLPDGRFLFGGRGGLDASDRGIARSLATLRASFDAMFPAWRSVETEYSWSGMVCLTWPLTPFAGRIEGIDGAYAAFGWHGNGVAMASYAGNRLAHVVAGDFSNGRQYSPDPALPAIMQRLPGRFPATRFRLSWLRAAYLGYAIADALP